MTHLQMGRVWVAKGKIVKDGQSKHGKLAEGMEPPTLTHTQLVIETSLTRRLSFKPTVAKAVDG